MAADLRAGRTTSRALVEAHVARIRTVNPRINALVCERFEQALAEADAADQRLRTERDLPPLLGVPCTIKENFACAGMPQTSGLVARRNHIAEADAPTVARLRAAGAIPLGTSNVPELCMWMETANRVYGRTRNPYDPHRIAGGSSGGEGALIGAGASPFGLGADVGGSIRLPAFFNGVYGHKPSPGLVPNTGQIPLPENEVSTYCVTGPLCRRAEDLMPLLRILSGPDGIDRNCGRAVLGDPAQVDLSRVTVTVVPGDGRYRVSDDLARAQARAATALQPLVRSVTQRGFDDLRASFWIWAGCMSKARKTPFGVQLGGGRPIRLGYELSRWCAGRSPHTLPALMLAAAERKRIPVRHLNGAGTLREQMLDALGDHGVLLYPPYTRPAPRHNAPLLTPMHWTYSGIFNVLGFPVTQVPLGLNGRGLPLGVQIVAAPGNDHLSIRVAMELERLVGGWVPPWSRFSARPETLVAAPSPTAHGGFEAGPAASGESQRAAFLY